MKVFELMAQLSKCPAGAEVEFRTILTAAEFNDAPLADSYDYNSPVARSLTLNIGEVELINDSLTVIYQ